MRWPVRVDDGWRRRFAILPVNLGDHWLWLGWYERRFMCDCYEVRPPERTIRMTTDLAALREALEPFARLAGPINGEEGRPTYLEAISGPNGTDELCLSTYVGDGTRIEILDAGDFRRARQALAALEAPAVEAREGRSAREKRLNKLMMAMARTHDRTVSEREKGAALALRCGNGMATLYWREIAKTAIRAGGA